MRSAASRPGHEHHRHADAGLGARAGEHDVLAPQVAGPERPGLEERVRRRERGAALHAAGLPVQGGRDVLDLDRVAEADVAALLQRADDLVAVARALGAPVDGRVEVRGREQDVVDLLAVGGERRVGARRVGDEDARVAHELLLVDQLVEHALPRPAEVDVVVRDLAVRRRRPGEQQEARGGVGQARDRPRLAPEQVAVGDRQVGVEHHDVGGDALAVRRDDGDGAVADRLDRRDLGAVAELDAVLLGRGRHGRGNGVHAALGEEHPGDRVHVGDDRVDGERVVRRDARVHGLEGVDALRARVLQVLAHLRGELAEAAEGDEPGQVGRQQVEGRVDVAVDEVVHLVLVELRDEVDVPAVAGGLLRR